MLRVGCLLSTSILRQSLIPRYSSGMCRPVRFDGGAVQHTGPFPIWSKTVRGTVGSASPLYIDLMNFYMLLIDIECWNDFY